MFNFNEKLEKIPKLGEKTSNYFAKKEIYTIDDLLCFLPISYNEYVAGEYKDKEKILFNGTITTKISSYRPRPNLTVTNFKVSDGINEFKVVVWNQPHLKFTIKQSDKIELFGVYDQSNSQITANKITIITDEANLSNQIIPVYSKIANISNIKLNKFILSAIEYVDCEDKIKDMLKGLHNPEQPDDILKSQEEFKKLELKEYLKKIEILKVQKEIADVKNSIAIDIVRINKFKDNLPFGLTNSQEEVIIKCLKHMQSEKLLQALVLGDVGSGKTIVSLVLSLGAILDGNQVAIMVPTDILARQFYEQIQFYLSELKSELLISSVAKLKKKRIKDNLQMGNIEIVVGTQALLEEDVEFKNLKFVVVDEQHRFGVMQRQTLINKGKNVNYIYLSATPIPRTIAHSLYGVIDVYEIKEKPLNRKEIITNIYNEKEKGKMLNIMEKELEKGNQAFIVTPLAYEIEDFNLADSYSTYERFSKYYEGKYNVGVINGQLKAKDKELIMKKFRNHEYDILVSTTVIEVGVDVKDATVMMILNGERFGIAQLHQLRGRVGRNNKQSFCLVQNNTTNEVSKKRLDLLSSSNNGFELAKEDYKLRQSGEVTGLRQSGAEDFILFNPSVDFYLLDNQNV